MKIVIGCDVDPVLPQTLTRPLSDDIWSCVDRVDALIEEMGSALPPITWLIRSDASVKFATGEWASGYLSREKKWRRLAERGHELGWHMHLWSLDEKTGVFRFDAEPSWIAEAHQALSKLFPVSSTRTGWDYGSNFLMNSLDRLGILIDFSAFAEGISWIRVGKDTVMSNWLLTPNGPYRPDRENYQKSGQNPLRLVELPLTDFRNGLAGRMKRCAWRAANGCFSLRGLHRRIKTLTEPWEGLPHANQVMAFYLHPEDLTNEGRANFVRNIALLAKLPGAEFVTASNLAKSIQKGAAVQP